MGKARRERRAAKGGGGGEEPSEAKLSRRKIRKMEQKAEREALASRPSALKPVDLRTTRSAYTRMSISQLEALLARYGEKEKFADRVKAIQAELKIKRKQVAERAKTTEGEQPRSLPRRKSRLVGFVENEIYLIKTRKRR